MAKDQVKEAINREMADVMAAIGEVEVPVDIAAAAAFTIGLHVGILLAQGHPNKAEAVLRSLKAIQGADGGNGEAEAAVMRFAASVPASSRAN